MAAMSCQLDGHLPLWKALAGLAQHRWCRTRTALLVAQWHCG